MIPVQRGALPNDDRFWRIEWPCGIRRNSMVASEFQLEVVIAPLLSVKDPYNITPQEALNINFSERKTIYLGVGTMPSLIIGSVYHRRRVLPVVPYQIREFNIDLNDSTMMLLKAGHMLPDPQHKRWLIPPPPYGIKLPPAALNTNCVAISVNNDPHALIIPCFEVLRAWLIRSSAMAIQIFSERLQTGRDKIYDPQKSGIFDGECRVQLREGFGASDVYPAALLACYPLAFRRAAHVFDSIIKNHTSGKPAHLEMLPPNCRGQIRGRGIELSTPTAKRFLIFDLIEIPYPLAPSEIVWDIDNSISIERNSDSENATASSGRTQSRAPNDQDVIEHLEEPDKSSAATRETYLSPQISTPFKLQKVDPKKVARLNPGSVDNDTSEGAKHSTGRGTYGTTSSKRVSIVGKPSASIVHLPRNPIGFTLILSMQALFKRYTDTQCVSVAASEEVVMYEKEIHSLFPKKIGDIQHHHWSFVRKIHPREAVVLEVQHEGLFGYAIEIERRPSQSVSVKPESFRLGFVSGPSQEKLELKKLTAVLENCAKGYGIWPTGGEIEKLKLRAFKHTRAPEDFAFDLLNELRRRAGWPALDEGIKVKDQTIQAESQTPALTPLTA